MVFALAMGLRLARFNSMIDVEKPKWQSNYFTGMPAPAGAITVLLPLYLDGLGLFSTCAGLARADRPLHAGHGVPAGVDHPDVLGQESRRADPREYVLPIFVGVALLIALLVTYPYETLTIATVAYLAMIPLSIRQYLRQSAEDERARKTAEAAAAPNVIDIRLSDGGQR